MNLVVFTPALKASAIGRMSSLVTRALTAHGHSVVVVRSEDASLHDAETHDFGVGVEMVPWTQSAQIASLLRSVDSIVYQIGNEYAYHRGCLEWLPHFPGVICLHDFFLGNLFYGWAQNRRENAKKVLSTWYGNGIADTYFSYTSSEAFINGTKDTAPMTEWVCAMAHGVIVHSNWGVQRVLESCPGPVEVVPLAYDAPYPMGGLVKVVTSPHTDGDRKVTVLTIGHVNPNKRAESVIRAIAGSAILRHQIQYRLVGKIEPDTADRLAALASSLQVDLMISGEVDADVLGRAIVDSDIICCLRWPTIEGASASAIEAMLYGKPVIVTDAGFYAELPGTYVRKVSVETETSDLQRILEALCADNDGRLVLGREAASWAAATFSADNYARRLVDVSLATQRAALIIKTLQSMVELLGQWGGSQQLMSLPDTLDALSLFNNSPIEIGHGARI